MKHRVLSLALVLMLCLAMLPTGALAADVDAALDVVAAVEETVAEEIPAEASAEEEAETLLSGGVAIDETNFPDETFRGYVSSDFDDDGNGYLSEEEIAAATSFNHTYRSISDLTGIEYLTELTYLNVEGCNLTSLDLNANTKLESLRCTSNALTSLNVKNCSALVEINCSFNQLTSLDVSNNTKLRSLSCAENQLTSLDVSNNTALIKLGCGYNQLTELDVSNNTELYSMSCVGNQLTALNIAGIDWLLRAYNGSKMDMGDGSVEYSYFDYSEDVYAALTVDTATVIYTEAGAGGSGSATNGVAVDETNFPDAIFRAYVAENFDTDGDEYLSDEEIAAVEKIQVRNMGITSLDGIEKFVNLRQLECTGNSIEKLDLSKNTMLYSLYCENNGMKELDVSKNAALYYLYCANNELTSLDVSANTELVQLGCWGNKLQSLNVKNNTKLKGLQCGENMLTSLDVSGLTALEMVRCENNQLTDLNVVGCTALNDLICSGNQLVALNVSDNTALLQLSCAGNMIECLNLCNNPALLYVLASVAEPEEYNSVNGAGGFYVWLEYFCEYEDDYASLGVDPAMVIVTPDGEIVTPEIETGGEDGGETGGNEGDSGDSGDVSDEVKAAYTEYIAAFLEAEMAAGSDIEPGLVEELLAITDAGIYEDLAAIMSDLYNSETISAEPLTFEEFAAQYGAEEEILLGDTDGDGEVFVDDLVVLMKSIINVDGAEVSAEAGDLNVDGAVDILDVICLVRELAQMYPATG